MAMGVGPAVSPSTLLTIGPWGERRKVMLAGCASLTAICCSVFSSDCQRPSTITCSGFCGLVRSAIRSTSSFWNMVRLQPKSRLWPSRANGLSAWK